MIAAVAAAGIGIIVQNAQTKTSGQVGTQDLSVSGTITIKGSTTILPITQAEVAAFEKQYPAVTINVGGGGSGTGRALVDTKQVDIGASSALWPNGPQFDSVTNIHYGGRDTDVIESAGTNAFVHEQKIGTGMIVVIGNIPGITAINVVNSSGNTSGVAGGVLTLTYGDLKYGYQTGTINATITGTALTTVSRSDDSGTEQTFAQWIGLNDAGADNQIKAAYKNLEKTAQGNQGIRDLVAANSNYIGFVDIGFAAGGVNGNAADIPSSMGGIVAGSTTKGVGGAYDSVSKTVSNSSNGLARDLYYYSQPGIPAANSAVGAYLNFVMSGAGQAIVQNEGFFLP